MSNDWPWKDKCPRCRTEIITVAELILGKDDLPTDEREPNEFTPIPCLCTFHRREELLK